METIFSVNVTNKTGVDLIVASGDTLIQPDSSNSFSHEFGKPFIIQANGGNNYAARVKSLHAYELDFTEEEAQSEWILTVGSSAVVSDAMDGSAGNSTVNVTIDGDD